MSRLLLNGDKWLANTVPLRTSRGALADVAGWDHSWDAADSTVSGSRATTVPDYSGGHDLVSDDGSYGTLVSMAALSGPTYSASDSRFSGRPSLYTDQLGTFGGVLPICSMLSTTSDPHDDTQLFNSAQGYDMPYLIGVLARPINAGGGSVWDSYREGAPTVGSGPASRTYWGGTTGLPGSNAADTVNDLWPETTIARSESRTVLALYYFNAASSWMQISERTAAGPITTTRQACVFTDRNPSSNPLQAGFREGFIGFVSACYWAATVIELAPADVDATSTALIAWASPWLPPP